MEIGLELRKWRQIEKVKSTKKCTKTAKELRKKSETRESVDSDQN
jgi:hypothetical protein